MRRQSIRRWLRGQPGILGINRRNLEFIYPRNPRDRFPLVDDKIRTKERLAGAGLPVPDTLEVVRWRREIRSTLDRISEIGKCVIKPARGFGGQGILVLRRVRAGFWETPSGRGLDRESIEFHMAAILSGMYSLDHVSERVLVEERLEETPELARLHGGSGVSDLRLIVAGTTPVMAMLRMPCARSGGTANLHAGGVGAGVDLRSGITMVGICRGRPIAVHPDTNRPLEGVQIPVWAQVLDLARRIPPLVEMGFVGVDVAFDAARGPRILEVNARPGLAIQLANRTGLLEAIPAHERRTG